VTVSETPSEVRFRCGSFSFDLSTLPDLEGRRVRLHLERAPGALGIGISPDRAEIVNGQAAIRFPFVAPGVYLLWMDAGPGTGFYLEGTYDRESAFRLPVYSRRTTQRHFFLDRPGRVRGRIRGSWQRMGLAPPVVEAHRLGQGRVAWVETGEDGGFVLEKFVAGPVRISVVIGRVARWIGGDDFAGATEFPLAPGDDLTLPSYEESGILCRLRGPGDLPPAAVKLDLTDSTGYSYALTDRIWRSGDPVMLANLRPGLYLLGILPVEPDGEWCEQWYDGAASYRDATPIRIERPDETVEITVRLHPEGTVSGRVTMDPPGQGPVRVSLVPLDGGIIGQEATADAVTGEFRFSCVFAGEYKLGAPSAGHPGETWYPGTAVWDEAETITVGQGEDVAGLEWELGL